MKKGSNERNVTAIALEITCQNSLQLLRFISFLFLLQNIETYWNNLSQNKSKTLQVEG